MEYLKIKVIQGGQVEEIKLTKANLEDKFRDVYLPLLKKMGLKSKHAYLSTDSGRMVSKLDLHSSLREIIKKYGNKLKLYYEKIR